MVFAFLTIIAAGLFGNQNPALNIAPLLTWTIWWCGLVVLIMFAGKAWCYMCPWDAIAGWMEKLRFWKKTDQGCGLELRWPRVIRNIFIATLLFIGLTWVELGFGVTMSPRATAYLAIAMLAMAIVSAFLFDRKSFCRYGCLVGRVSGLYALFAGIEVRSRDGEICNDCHTKECVRGSETAYGCPTFEYPGTMDSNTYCIQCGECLQACPHDNLAVNLRPWGADLANIKKPRSDEAYLALLMLSISGFHGLTMTPVWGELTGLLEDRLSLDRIASFTAGMAGLMAFPILIYAALVAVSLLIVKKTDSVGSSEITYRDYFIRYAYCALPIALFYHLAHNLEHLLMEGPKVVALMSDPFGWGWNLLGTAGWTIPPLVSLDVLWILQVALVGVGHVYSLWSAQRIGRGMFTSEVAASRGQWPMLVGMIAFSVFSLWLLKQPMEMRTSAM
jgi:ferredoxin